jgi:hypothetical protein
MTTKDSIDERILRFKEDLSTEETLTIVNKYITHGSSVLLDDETYFSLKNEVAKQFNIHTTNIFMVGSAKMGFSIKTSRRFLPFGNSSDIDIAIISNALFEQIWKEVYSFQNESGWWPEAKGFRKYLFKGWIRPDFLPTGKSFALAQQWWEFFRRVTESGSFGPYKVNAGVYHSIFFFESYQSICINECKSSLEV